MQRHGCSRGCRRSVASSLCVASASWLGLFVTLLLKPKSCLQSVWQTGKQHEFLFLGRKRGFRPGLCSARLLVCVVEPDQRHVMAGSVI